jgi:predicted DNA-binding protein YlxM (UPF0122 family)
MIDKKLCVMLYENGHGFTEIATTLHVSKQRIHQIIKNYKNYGWKRFNKKEKKLLKAKMKCAICRQPTQIFHHIDRNNANESIENLMPLCKKCHKEIHRGEKHISKVIRKVYQKKRKYTWSIRYKECILCLSTDHPHKAKGMCSKCYNKKSWENYKSIRS